MTYKTNSLEAQKGALGEVIVKNFLECWNVTVTRPDEHGQKALVDFLVVPKEGSAFSPRYAEVKVRRAIPYAYGQYPCYAFPVVQIEAYKAYGREKNLPVQIFLVDPDEGKIFTGTFRSDTSGLESKRFIDGKEFPFDQETKCGIMRFFHRKQFAHNYNIETNALAALRKLFDADKNEGIAVKWLYGLRAPNGTLLEICVTKKAAFLYLPQICAAGIDSNLILQSQRRSLGNFDGEFLKADVLYDCIKEQSKCAEFCNWWSGEGWNSCNEIFDAFKDTQDFFAEHFGVDLPDEWTKLLQNRDAFVQSLNEKPLWIILNVTSKLHAMETTWEEKSFASQISGVCSKICAERPVALGKVPKVITLKNFADKIGERVTPGSTLVEFFAVKGIDKIFVHGARLAMAAGYANQAGATADKTDFTKAVDTVAQYYGIRLRDKVKAARFVDVKDVPAVLHEFAFNRTRKQNQYETATKLLHWWNEENTTFEIPKVETPQDNSSPKELLKQLADVVSVDKSELYQVILDLRTKNFEREQTKLKELLI